MDILNEKNPIKAPLYFIQQEFLSKMQGLLEEVMSGARNPLY